MKKQLWSLAAIALLLGACGETTVEKVETDTSSEEVAAEEEATEEEAAPEFYKVGDTVSVDGVNLTITSASFTDPAEYSEVENDKVLTLEVAVENTNDTSSLVDSTDFSLYDAEGNQMSDYYSYDEMPISTDLNAGKKAKGKLYFDVTEGTTYELIYVPFFSLDGKEVKWNIEVQ